MSNDHAQPENACPIIDRLTRPLDLLPSSVPNGEDSKLCAANGWIDEGWEHVTGTLSLTRPLLPSSVPNGEDSKLCAANGWIDEGWEHVTGTLSKLSG